MRRTHGIEFLEIGQKHHCSALMVPFINPAKYYGVIVNLIFSEVIVVLGYRSSRNR